MDQNNASQEKNEPISLEKALAFVKTLQQLSQEEVAIKEHLEKKIQEQEEQITKDCLKLFEKHQLLEMHFKVKDTKLDQKLYYYFKNDKNNGFIPTHNSRKWKNINFVDYIWIEILETLRKFSCPHETIKKVYKECYGLGYTKEILELKKHRVENEGKENDTKSNIKEHTNQIDSINQVITNQKTIAVLDEYITLLYLSIINCMKGKELYLVIDEEQQISISGNVESQKPQLVLPLSSFLVTFVRDESKKAFWKTLALFTQKELELIDLFTEYPDAYVSLNRKDIVIKNVDELKEILVLKKYFIIEMKIKSYPNVLQFYP